MQRPATELHRRRDAGPSLPLDRRLSQAAEVMLALAIVVPTFIFGGREAVGQSALASFVLLGCGLAALRCVLCDRKHPALLSLEFLLPAAMLLVYVLTWVPLPPDLIQGLSPSTARLLPEWTTDSSAGTSLGGWRAFSLAPGLSRDATLLLLTGVLTFWGAFSTLRTAESAWRLLKILFWCGVAVALVGFLNYLFWNGKFYGLWEVWWVPPDRQVRAPFTNRNHFAGFLALTLGAGIAHLAQLLRGSRDLDAAGDSAQFSCGPSRGERAPQQSELKILLTAAGLILILTGIFLTQSRGGALAALIAAGVALLGTLPGNSWAKATAACAGVGLVALAVVFLFGDSRPLERVLGTFSQRGTLDDLTTHRLMLWKADLGVVADFPLLGGGPGAHALLYPLHLERRHAVYTHAENGYLQVLVECGLAGGFVLAIAVAAGLRRCVGNLTAARRASATKAAACSTAAAAGLFAALAQGAVDFVWYVPAYAATMAVLAAIACRSYRLRVAGAAPADRTKAADTGARHPRFWGCALAGAWALAAFAFGVRFADQIRIERAWHAYHSLLDPVAAAEGRRLPPDRIEELAKRLAPACVLGASDPECHYRLGLLRQEQFLNELRSKQGPETIVELDVLLRDEGVAASRDAAAWIRRRFQCDCEPLYQAQAHFRQALRCCPLLGAAYLRLAELSFLEPPGRLDPAAYCRQAMLVRPYDPQIWIDAGVQCCTADQVKAAGPFWRRACELDSDSQWKLLPVLAQVLPPREIVELMPINVAGLDWLADQPLVRDQPAERQYLAEQAVQLVEGDPDQRRDPEAWLSLCGLCAKAQLDDEAEQCLRKAAALAPAQPACLVRLVRWLIAHGKPGASLVELQKLRAEFPDEPEIPVLETALLRNPR